MRESEKSWRAEAGFLQNYRKQCQKLQNIRLLTLLLSLQIENLLFRENQRKLNRIKFLIFAAGLIRYCHRKFPFIQ